MRELLVGLVLLGTACTGEDDVAAEPDAGVDAGPTVDAEAAPRMQGAWNVRWTCEGACVYFRPPLVDSAVLTVDGLTLVYDLPSGPERHEATASVGCLVVAGVVDAAGMRRAPYQLCRIGDAAEDLVTWTTPNSISETWRLNAWR